MKTQFDLQLEIFKEKLINEYNQALSYNNKLSQIQRKQNIKVFNMGCKFLQSIIDLHSLNLMNEKLLTSVVEASTNLISQRSEQNLAVLSARISAVKNKLDASKGTNRFFAGVNAAFDIVGVGAGVGMTFLGYCLISGFLLLSMGPIGGIFLGIGAAVLGILIMEKYINDFEKQVRFCRDKQLEEIDDFVKELGQGIIAEQVYSMPKQQPIPEQQCYQQPPTSTLYPDLVPFYVPQYNYNPS